MSFHPALSADAALLLFTAGVSLIYLEFNRPGLVLPGALGLTLALVAVGSLLRLRISPVAGGLALLGFVLLALSAWSRAHVPMTLLATAALLYGFLRLVASPSTAQTHTGVAVACALLLGAGTSLLSTIAARARQNKGLDL